MLPTTHATVSASSARPNSSALEYGIVGSETSGNRLKFPTRHTPVRPKLSTQAASTTPKAASKTENKPKNRSAHTSHSQVRGRGAWQPTAARSQTARPSPRGCPAWRRYPLPHSRPPAWMQSAARIPPEYPPDRLRSDFPVQPGAASGIQFSS